MTGLDSFQAQMNQCRKAIETEDGEIYIHCVGNAIKRGITLALKLIEESNNGLAYEANTSTIDLIGKFHTRCTSYIVKSVWKLDCFIKLSVTDDLHPLNDEEDFSIQKRKNSCLHIRIFRQSNTITGQQSVKS